jgi:hypothetical protein
MLTELPNLPNAGFLQKSAQKPRFPTVGRAWRVISGAKHHAHDSGILTAATALDSQGPTSVGLFVCRLCLQTESSKGSIYEGGCFRDAQHPRESKVGETVGY